jgi:hypothetical protein
MHASIHGNPVRPASHAASLSLSQVHGVVPQVEIKGKTGKEFNLIFTTLIERPGTHVVNIAQSPSPFATDRP